MKTTATNNLIFEETIELYPNPASDFLYAYLEDENHGIQSISISNAIGRLVYQHEVDSLEDHLIIPIQSLNEGIYFISFSDRKNQLTKKFVKR